MKMPIPTSSRGARWLPLLVLTVLIVGCHRSSSNESITLTKIGAAGGIPETLDSVVPIEGGPFLFDGQEPLQIEVSGIGLFPVTVVDDGHATWTIPANTLPPGTRDVRLVRGFARSSARSLTVNPPPAPVAMEPSAINPQFNEPCAIAGTGFRAPVRVLLLDPNGIPVTAPTTGAVNEDGTRVDLVSPILPDLNGASPITLVVENGDGQRSRTGLAAMFDALVWDERTIDGTDNNTDDTPRGSAGIRLRRQVPYAYEDGISSLAGSGRPSAREISNSVCQNLSAPSSTAGRTDMLWLWGQFLDHDLDLTETATPVESAPIAVPLGDPSFDPFGTGTEVIPFSRSHYDPATGTGPGNPRAQINDITSWLDGSQVYGSDLTRHLALRALDGTGRLRTTAGDLLPFNDGGFDNAPDPNDPTLFLAGDVRANENVGLTAMHTLFVREHNRLADAIRAQNPSLSDEQIFQAARRWVVAELQVITFEEFLPALLGPGAIPDYAGYDESIDPAISALFSTAVYRFGHSLVSSSLERLDETLSPIAEGPLPLREAFFAPDRLIEGGGIEPLLRGFAMQLAQELDAYIVEDLRSFLFGPPGSGGLDLAALNIQRGRDHGLPSYNGTRVALGLPAKSSFAEITGDGELQSRLATAYADVDEIDAWVGALAEDPMPGALVGELIWTVTRGQFLRLRSADRHWYQRVFSGAALEAVEATRLADIIRSNTQINTELPDDVFREE
ncbi:MAG: peroxidase family protein [Planctomycetota bacterium]